MYNNPRDYRHRRVLTVASALVPVLHACANCAWLLPQILKSMEVIRRMANQAMRHYLVGGRPVYDENSPYYDDKKKYNDGPMCAALFAR